MSSELMLAVRGLRKSFAGFQALTGVTLDLPRGDVLGLVGPNGSGKTTLLNAICGIYRPDGGTVQFLGTDVTGLPVHRMSALGVNRTFQVPKPFGSLTVGQNIDVARQHSRRGQQDPQEVLEFIGLKDFVDREARTLNTAQQKLLDLGRALATSPDLILVDELGAGLSPADLDLVAEKLHALHEQGMTLLIVEHLMGFLGQLTRRVVVMNAGAEIFDGDIQTASRDPQVVEVFLGG